MKAFEIRQKRAAVVAEARKVGDRADLEKRELTPEEKAEVRAKLDLADKLAEDVAQAERLESLESEVNASGHRSGAPLPHNDPANAGTRHSYSLLKALREGLDAREGRGHLTGLEAETHTELEKRRGRKARGVMVPWDLPADARSGQRFGEHRTGVLNTTTGTGSVPTILDATMIDILRTRMLVGAAGATVMTDMQGLFAIPRMSGAATVYWVAEGSAPTSSNQTIDQVPFSPKTAGAYTDYTRRFLEETNQSAENVVRTDLMKVVARGVDAAAFTGSGSSNQPTGILNNASITQVVPLGTNGGAPTWASLVSLQTQVSIANADFGSLKYLTNAQGRSTLKQALKVTSSTFPIYLWDDAPRGADGLPRGEVNGMEALVSNQLPANLTKGSGANLSPVLFGNWEDLVLAFWSGLDIMVDPYTGSNTGNVRVVCLQDVDINVRHPQSFAYINDMVTN